MTAVNPLGPWMQKDAFGISIKSDHPNYNQIIEAIGIVLCDNGRVELGTQLLDSLIKFQEPVDIHYMDLPEEDLPGMWEKADFTGGKTDYDQIVLTQPMTISERIATGPISFMASHSDPDD